jgi:hypothetical protein
MAQPLVKMFPLDVLRSLISVPYLNLCTYSIFYSTHTIFAIPNNMTYYFQLVVWHVHTITYFRQIYNYCYCLQMIDYIFKSGLKLICCFSYFCGTTWWVPLKLIFYAFSRFKICSYCVLRFKYILIYLMLKILQLTIFLFL